MKKLILVVITAVSLLTANAQSVKFGVKAGLNLATIKGDYTDNFKMRTSFHVGGVAEFVVSDKFSFQPELTYSAQGAKVDSSSNETFQFDYINFPIIIKFFVAEGFSIEAGPQIAFNVNARIKSEGITADIEDISTIDFGINFGLGYKLEQDIFFNARYIWGSNLNDIAEIKNHNEVIQVSIGYLF